MSYRYGVSYNCVVADTEIGGGGEYFTSIDYVGNDLEKIKKKIEDQGRGTGPVYILDAHPLVGEIIDSPYYEVSSLTGEVLFVFGKFLNDEHNVDNLDIEGVIFEYPNMPEIIE